jgi:hypothetical protein
MTRVAQRAAIQPWRSGSSFYVGSTGPIGSASMTNLAVIVRNAAPHQAAQQEMFGNFAGGGGFLLSIAGTTRILQYLVFDGGGVQRIPTPTFAFPVGNADGFYQRFFVCAMSHDGVTARWNLNNVITGSVACAGFTPATSNVSILAREGGTSQTRAVDFVAGQHTDTAAASAAGLATIVAQALDDLAQGRYFTPIPSAEHYWDARDIVTPGLPLVTWPDRIGAMDLSRSTRNVGCACYAARPA